MVKENMLTQISGNGIYSWHTHPIAKRHESNTFFGAINDQSVWRVFKNSATEAYTNLASSSGTSDDHNAPAVLTNQGKDTLAFFTKHDKDNKIRFFRAAEGTLNFVRESELIFPNNTTYCQALSLGDRVILLTRSGSSAWYFRKSENYGQTWGSPVKLLQDTVQYYMCFTESETTPGTVYFTGFPHPTKSNDKDILFGALDLDTGDISTSAGTVDNILTPTNLPLTYSKLDGLGVVQNSQQRFRFLDIAEKHGKVVVYYAKWAHSTAQPYYYQAVQNEGGGWTRTALNIHAPIFSSNGGANYVGGISIDKNNNDWIYMSQRGTGGTWSINRYPLNSNFTLGAREILVTNTKPLVRPYAVQGADQCIYQYLKKYNSYTDYFAHLYRIDF